MTSPRSYSLLELCQSLRACIAQGFDGKYWIHAETLDVRTNASSGHCYLELVQKGEGGELVARMRAMMWRGVAGEVCSRFREQTGMDFVSGLEVMLLVSVGFHEQFGLSVVIHNIDPAYTLGDLARRKREIVAQLKREGLIGLNGQIALPRPIQRLAIISSASAAGYGDFVSHLGDTPEKFVFYTRLFPAGMQGEQAEVSILSALEQIEADRAKYDAVVLIRGGGAVAELSCFDSYALAKAIALFPLPVFCGIGHDRDLSIVDMVSAISLKTPTAVADYLLGLMRRELETVEELRLRLRMAIRELLAGYAERQDRLAHELQQPVHRRMRWQSDELYRLCHGLSIAANRYLQNSSAALAEIGNKLPLLLRERKLRLAQEMEALARRLAPAARQVHAQADLLLRLQEQAVRLSEPGCILRRGFTYVTIGDRFCTSAVGLQAGQLVELHFSDGSRQATVEGNTPPDRSRKNSTRI
ncbi:MAG: exodeoxyribonuclease VII large subunit [Porphyromonas sp.]|nr:exodeoxyribonuclease VII large subunit [Porphyromonas sp.]